MELKLSWHCDSAGTYMNVLQLDLSIEIVAGRGHFSGDVAEGCVEQVAVEVQSPLNKSVPQTTTFLNQHCLPVDMDISQWLGCCLRKVPRGPQMSQTGGKKTGYRCAEVCRPQQLQRNESVRRSRRTANPSLHLGIAGRDLPQIRDEDPRMPRS